MSWITPFSFILVASTFALIAHAGLYEQCDAFICEPGSSYCSSRSDLNVYLNPDACPGKLFKNNSCLGGEECFISEDDSESYCLASIDKSFPLFLYPGYDCDFYAEDKACTFGPK